jgi:hypothetical protein
MKSIMFVIDFLYKYKVCFFTMQVFFNEFSLFVDFFLTPMM